MRKVIEFQILDTNAIHYGVNLSDLMDNAGAGISDYIISNFDLGNSVSFVCGPGNNGGDGYVASNILIKEGYDVRIFTVSKPNTSILKKKYDLISGSVREIDELFDLEDKTNIVVDCLLGSGIKGSPRPPYDKYIDFINTFETIISIDIPSGLGTEYSVNPDVTITFHDYKIGMDENNSGIIILHDVGFPKDLDETTGPGELLLYPDFNPEKHKGQNGKVAVVGGGVYSGAPALSALGCYRAGADLVHVFVPESSFKQVSTFTPELLVHKLSGEIVTKMNLDILFEQNFDSVVVGPGMGKDSLSLEAVKAVIENCDNIVIDADAISKYDFRNKNIVLTPHKGELPRLGISTSKKDLIEFSSKNNVTLLLKGQTDVITDGYFIKNNTTGHPRMAVGGSGDVLAGICGAFMAKGLTPFESARLASYSIGKAGEECYNSIGSGFLPTDLALFVSKILKKN